MEILTCQACGGQVPLGDGDVLSCPFCSERVELPVAHRQLRDAERRDAAARTEAAALFAHYGKKPSLPLRIAAVVFHPILLPLGLFFFLLCAMFGVLFLSDLVSPLVHANLWDTVPDAPKGYGLFVLAAGSVLFGIALGVYGRRRILSTRSLQAALAARPPTRAGERALCRECAAPLYIPGEVEGVRCAYCHADNLVAVPADWIAGIVAAGTQIGRAIEGAAAWAVEEQRRFRRSLKLHLMVVGGVFLVFILLIALNPRSRPGWRAGWSEYVKEPRTLVRLRNGIDRKQVPLGSSCEKAPVDVISQECKGETCRIWLYAPLRAGERLSLEGATQVRATMHGHFWWGKTHEEGFGPEVGGADFTAPWSAWYQLRVDLPRAARSLCAVVR